MAQPLQSINLVAPAFKGVNTEDSPIAQDQSYADLADNAVIDKRGRIAARQGVDLLTDDAASFARLGGDYIKKVHYFYDDFGNSEVFSAANNTIFRGTETLTPMTVTVDSGEASYVITNDNWKIVNFNNKCYFFQKGHKPLVYDATSDTLQTFWSVTGSSHSTEIMGNEVLAAYGRLWVADSTSNSQVVYWSDLLIGEDYTGGSSGSIDISEVWPDGFDEIKALVAHNSYLIIFGKHSIVVYAGAESPANMVLEDTVAGVGCICRNSVQHTGTDVLFVSEVGLRSFARVIQEKSMPLTDLSINVRTDFIEEIDRRVGPTASVYSPENSFYLITFPEASTTYCFDLKGKLENGGLRVTRWGSAPFKSYERTIDGRLLIGVHSGIGEYSGYHDQYWDPAEGKINFSSYRFRYYSPGLTFGDASKLKMLKKIRPTIVGNNNSIVSIRWAYDFETSFKTQQFPVGDQTPFYYNQPETRYNEALFTGGYNTSRKAVNTTGAGTVITIGLESDINGDGLSLQEINVLALMGKTL